MIKKSNYTYLELLLLLEKLLYSLFLTQSCEGITFSLSSSLNILRFIFGVGSIIFNL